MPNKNNILKHYFNITCAKNRATVKISTLQKLKLKLKEKKKEVMINLQIL